MPSRFILVASPHQHFHVLSGKNVSIFSALCVSRRWLPIFILLPIYLSVEISSQRYIFRNFSTCTNDACTDRDLLHTRRGLSINDHTSGTRHCKDEPLITPIICSTCYEWQIGQFTVIMSGSSLHGGDT